MVVLILWRCGLSSTEVRFLRRKLHPRYLDFILFLSLRPKRLPGPQIPLASCSLIGAGSRLLYVTGCKKPLKLDPPRMSMKDAVLQPLSFVCRFFTLTSDGASIQQIISLGHSSRDELVLLHQNDCNRLCLCNLASFVGLLIVSHHSQFYHRIAYYSSSTSPPSVKLSKFAVGSYAARRASILLRRISFCCEPLSLELTHNTEPDTSTHSLQFASSVVHEVVVRAFTV